MTLKVIVAPTTLPNGTRNVLYSQQITASGGAPEPTYLFLLTGGALPDGLTLTDDGLISGRPSSEGAFTFEITALDQNHIVLRSGLQSYTVGIGMQEQGGSGGHAHGGGRDKKPPPGQQKKTRSLDSEPGADFSLVPAGARAFLAEVAAQEPKPVPPKVVRPVEPELDLSRAHAAITAAGLALSHNAAVAQVRTQRVNQEVHQQLQAQAAQRVRLAKIAAVVNAALTHGASA